MLVSVDETLKLKMDKAKKLALSRIIQYNNTNISKNDAKQKYNDVFFSIYFALNLGYLRFSSPHTWKNPVQ